MKYILTIAIFMFAGIATNAQTKPSNNNKQNSAKQNNGKKPRLSHSGSGLENTGTTAITITHNDTVNYQGSGKGASAKKPAAKKSSVKKTGSKP